ncbi:histidine phosphatase family protein [Salipaludibacillus daqingensis]|uniref:histidine phosphatase family protein n=1 Tax=Salipaludibacillus daqingensis TaxID=3041001 RepID=UPI00247545A8|nr:histidine phosphatase family protein [Salipaludibacillus daqingensis]
MVTIYVTRHGETEWNRENRLQGWKDSPLTTKGVENAVKLGKRLQTTDINAIYTSPSERALHTAEHISRGRDIPINKNSSLKEIYFGDWEGKNKDEITRNSSVEFSNFWRAPHLYNHELHNGEGLTDFKHRVRKVIQELINNHNHERILVVTHAVVIRAIMSYMMEIPTEKMWDPPFIHGTSLSVFQWDGETFHVQSLGDTSHF